MIALGVALLIDELFDMADEMLSSACCQRRTHVTVERRRLTALLDVTKHVDAGREATVSLLIKQLPDELGGITKVRLVYNDVNLYRL